MLNWKKILLALTIFTLVLITACGEESEESESESAQMDYTITGIEPGAGQTELNEQVIEDYDSFTGWSQQTSSTGAMLTELDNAIQNEEPIIFTAWSPHYMFAKYDLKFLEDPEGIFGEGQYAAKIARLGFEEDFPIAYEILDRFEMEVGVIEDALLLAQEEELDMEELANRWVEGNRDFIDVYTEGLDPVDGKSIEILTTQWNSELFISYVTSEILTEHGFDVTVTSVDPSILFEAIASGSGDVTTSPWLPSTHGELYDRYEGEFLDFGIVYEGSRIGLAVPTYMEVDSLEDFEANPNE
ncbi:glycine betaine/proline transport system substrate-binding protein [Streptohalobacillus salinus]|uniref:Glycine betaine/proline transport system substrate-binding protein n=1 Tax=Streptohalobacillus salinus TaxID=621096 RepID=A0A2V3VZ66_9BACI|nr:glycine betaine ABC transporter substrate-binding protein [Streptohalobacillus salinus]PXW87343.1 glycine betaine/proline transport system substrate-binding protein [Streptohalobacillus salinus]